MYHYNKRKLFKIKALFYFFKIFGLATISSSFKTKSKIKNSSNKIFASSKVGASYNILLCLLLILPNYTIAKDIIISFVVFEQEYVEEREESIKLRIILLAITFSFEFLPQILIIVTVTARQNFFAQILNQMKKIEMHVENLTFDNSGGSLSMRLSRVFYTAVIYWFIYAFSFLWLFTVPNETPMTLRIIIYYTYEALCRIIIQVTILQCSLFLHTIANAFEIVNNSIKIILSRTEISIERDFGIRRYVNDDTFQSMHSYDFDPLSVQNFDQYLKLRKLSDCRKLHRILIETSKLLSDYYSPMITLSLIYIFIRVVLDFSGEIKCLAKKECWTTALGFASLSYFITFTLGYIVFLVILTNAASSVILKVLLTF